MDRRLTTILAADMVGYSRLMAADEEGVIARLRRLRKDLIDPAIAEHNGRIVKTMGDGLLVEFPSPLSAVRMAVTAQNAMQDGETGPDDQRIRFRIGVNTGDIVIDGDDILGDAVNIAARLESLAPPGGICIGRTAHDQIKGQIDADLTALGPQMVKNIPNPVEVWRVEIEGVTAPVATTKAERSSIAVLPFDNMSADPDQEFLADGIVEDVITELSRFRSLLVIARNSTFAYKGGHKDIRAIASELDVRYVVEGSVRHSGNRLRVTAQLIEAATGAHIWADRWDRTMDDLFDLQDELTHAIVGRIEPELGAHERTLALRKPPSSLTAWELYQRGLSEWYLWRADSLVNAKAFYHMAIKADPTFADPLGAMASACAQEVITMTTPDVEGSVKQGMDHARRCLAIDRRNELAQFALGFLLAAAGEFREGMEVLDRAIRSNPNNSELLLGRAMARQFDPSPEGRAIEEDATQALRLSPTGAASWGCHFFIGYGRLLEDPKDADGRALEAFEAACREKDTDAPGFIFVAIAAVHRDPKLAQRRLDQAKEIWPELTVKSLVERWDDPSWKILMSNVEDALELLVPLGLPTE